MKKLTKEACLTELKAAKAAVIAHQQGAIINQIVADAFEQELKKFKDGKGKTSADNT